MTLESLCSSTPFRLLFALQRLGVGLLSKLSPNFLNFLCYKLREIFSPRLNNILMVELITKNRWIQSAPCVSATIDLRLPLSCQLALDVKDYTQGDFYFSGFPHFTVELVH